MTAWDDYLEQVRASEANAEKMRNRRPPTLAEIGQRIANPTPQTQSDGEPLPVGGKPRDPRQVWDSIEALDDLINGGSPFRPPKLGTEQGVRSVLSTWLAGEALPVAEGQPWQDIVAKAIRTYDAYFGSMPDRQKLVHWEPGPQSVEEYEHNWAAKDRKLGFELDRLPITYDNYDAYDQLLPPWDPWIERNVQVIVSTSRPGHRWLVRGTTTVESVSDILYFNDNHCDLSYACCTKDATSARNKVFAFAHGDLIVLGMICASCWAQWCERQLPEPPEEHIYENDVEL